MESVTLCKRKKKYNYTIKYGNILKNVSNIVGDASAYSEYLRSLPEEISSSMPNFEILAEKISIKNWDEIKMVVIDTGEVWIYGSVQENEKGEKYRLRKAVMNTKDTTIKYSFVNQFYYLLEK